MWASSGWRGGGPFRFAEVSGKDGFLECVWLRAGPAARCGCAIIGRCVVAGESSEWGSVSGRDLLAWAGITRFRPPAFRCSTGRARQAVFEDSAHMMFADLPDPHLAGQIHVTRDSW